MFAPSPAAPMTLQLDWPDPRRITLWQVNRLPERLPALVEALVDTPTCLLPIERQVRTPVLGEPLRLAGLLYAWPDGRTLVGLEAADGSRCRLLERDGEARQYFGPAAVYRHTVRAETLEGCPPALRFCLAHRTWPSWDAQWEERHRTALAWIERALCHLAALDHQWTARATPDAAWSYALTRNPHLVGTLRLGEGYPEYDPSQPRDGRGRWTDGGSGDNGPAAGPTRTERLGREEVSYLVDPADAQAGGGAKPSGKPAVNPNFAKITKPAGDGYCVALVKVGTGLPATKDWIAGTPMTEKPDLQPGTVIATFDEEGRYPNNPTGNHAAFFVRYEVRRGIPGIVIYDQYRSYPPRDATPDRMREYTEIDSKGRRYRVEGPAERFIEFDREGSSSNNASAFSVVAKK